MPDPLHLTAAEHLPSHPFTDPEHAETDAARLRAMTRQLIDTYEDPLICDFSITHGAICQSDPQGRHFRIYYIQPDKLFRDKNLSVVGFFGQKRPNADVKPLLKADKQFEAIFPQFEGLLSLSTVRLGNGDFANLVLFSDDEAKDQWNFNPLHYETVNRISPPYYKNIRLNNGILPNGLADPDGLKLTQVRYIDFESMPFWTAIRSLDPPEN
jgi:hypothetical protein